MLLALAADPNTVIVHPGLEKAEALRSIGAKPTKFLSGKETWSHVCPRPPAANGIGSRGRASAVLSALAWSGRGCLLTMYTEDYVGGHLAVSRFIRLG